MTHEEAIIRLKEYLRSNRMKFNPLEIYHEFRFADKDLSFPQNKDCWKISYLIEMTIFGETRRETASAFVTDPDGEVWLRPMIL